MCIIYLNSLTLFSTSANPIQLSVSGRLSRVVHVYSFLSSSYYLFYIFFFLSFISVCNLNRDEGCQRDKLDEFGLLRNKLFVILILVSLFICEENGHSLAHMYLLYNIWYDFKSAENFCTFLLLRGKGNTRRKWQNR